MKSFRNVLGIVCLGILLVGGLSLGRAQEEEKRGLVSRPEKKRGFATGKGFLRTKKRFLRNILSVLEWIQRSWQI